MKILQYWPDPVGILDHVILNERNDLGAEGRRRWRFIADNYLGWRISPPVLPVMAMSMEVTIENSRTAATIHRRSAGLDFSQLG
jgi:hypothetical protein